MSSREASFFAFDDVARHAWMLSDQVRLDAFDRALRELVRPGDVVADLGTGTGILAVFAARAGARKVYAVERGVTGELAQKIFDENGLSDVITLIRDDIRDAEFPEPPDVLVSETLGDFGIDEDMSGLFRVALRRSKPGAHLIPGRLRVCVAPMFDAALFADFERFSERDGVKLGTLRRRLRERPLLGRLEGATRMGAAAPLFDIDVRTTAPPRLSKSVVPIVADGMVNLMGTWFEAELSPGVTLSTAGDAPVTHWRNLCFPVDPPLMVKAGQTLTFDLDSRSGGSAWFFHWRVEVNGEVREGDVLKSSGGEGADFLRGLGLSGASTGEKRESRELAVWACMLGGDPTASIEEMVERLYEEMPERYADAEDARSEVISLLSEMRALD